jgi:LuxR family maltose regulon positive regulatory protein
MTEIRTQDLRFTMPEVTALLRQLVESEVDEATVSVLEEKTEGWVTGLRLAMLSLRHRGDLDDLLAGLRGSSQYLMDYLISEVLSHHSPDIQDFLIKSSILDRLCGSLSEAVVGLAGPATSGRAYLETVANADLFIIPLDDQGLWYRYHHLFQQFLLHRLQQQHTPDEIAALHAQAADWFSQNGLIEEALQHALATGDTRKAVRLVTQHRHVILNQDQWPRLDRWLRLFPAKIVEAEPELLMLDALLKQMRSQLIDMPNLLKRVEQLLAQSTLEEETARHLQAEVDTFRGVLHFYAADPKVALVHLEQALAILPRNHYHMRSLALMMMGYAYQMRGDLDAAIVLASEKLLERPRNDMIQGRLRIMLCIIYWMEADLVNMFEYAQQVHSMLGSSRAQYFLGCVHYQRNELAAAERAFSAVVDRPYLSYGVTFAHASFGLALTYLAQGRPDQARQVADSTVAFMIETDNIFLLPVAQAFQAELAARQGRLAEAGQWTSQAGATQRRQAMTGFYGPQLALPKILLAQNTAESRQQAADYLAQWHDFVVSVHNTRFLIEVLALQALLHQAQGNRPAALDALTQAITLARPGGFIRLFVDLRPGLKPLLADLAQNGVAPAYIAKILAASDSSGPQDDESPIEDTPQSPKRSPHPALLESLTNREMDVLLLMADRLTNKEIARELVISTDTVKQHAINLYRKLHVNNRRQAVAKARDLGLLLPH